MDSSTLQNMGSLIRGLAAADMNDMPASSLDDPAVMATMAVLEFAPSQARTLLSKVNKQGFISSSKPLSIYCISQWGFLCI